MILCTFRALLSCLGQLNYVQAMWFAQNVQQLFSLCCNCWDIYALLTPVFLPKNACLFTKMSPSEELGTLQMCNVSRRRWTGNQISVHSKNIHLVSVPCVLSGPEIIPQEWLLTKSQFVSCLCFSGRVAKSDLNSTEAYFAIKIGPKMTQKLAPAEK